MFLLSCLLLVPVILAEDLVIQNKYVVQIRSQSRNTLRNIKVIGHLSKKLNLSSLSLHNIDKNAFENVVHIKILILSNNSLSFLRENTFASLTNLEELYLSYNHISRLERAFVGLNNLKVLDLSNTWVDKLRSGDLFGLTKSCVILLEGNDILTISTELFKNKLRRYNSFEKDNTDYYSDENTYDRGPGIRFMICIHDTKLISVEYYTEGEELASGCGTDQFYANGVLSLNYMGIATFQKGWYKLGHSPIHHIDLSFNNITRLTSEMLNDLPESIGIVNLAFNTIVRLEKGIIVNKHLRKLQFMFNRIIEIEDNVFINTNLENLTLSHNQLTGTKFAATLPPTLTEIALQHNQIAKISRKSFLELHRLEVLTLNANNITEIHNGSFLGLSSLKNLCLINNKLKKIKPGYFKGLTELEVLRLNFNDITELESGAFADLKNIKRIILSWNRLSNLTRDSLIGLSDTLKVLDLQYNALQNLKAGTFVNSPKYKLLLNNNNISNIEDGSFNLPNLQNLDLSDNFLSIIDSGEYQGLKNLQSLSLDGNNIMRIEKDAFKNLRSLCQLFMSRNPIKRLENGTLHGLSQKKGCHVELKDVPIEMIHGGVFVHSVDFIIKRLSLKDLKKKNYEVL